MVYLLIFAKKLALSGTEDLGSTPSGSASF